MKPPRVLTRNEQQKLTERQLRFYRKALQNYRAKMDWLDFEEFAFRSESPVYDGAPRRPDVLDSPLYDSLREMWLHLGVNQRMLKDDEKPHRAAKH